MDTGMPQVPSAYTSDIAESSTYARELATIRISQILASVDPRRNNEGKEDRSSTNNNSIYASDIPNLSDYAQALVTSFFRISEPLPDAGCLRRIHETLPDLLQGFAVRIGAECQKPEYFRVMRAIHGIRKLITSQFEEYYLNNRYNTEGHQRARNNAPWYKRFKRWQVDPVTEDPRMDPTLRTLLNKPPEFDDEGDLGNEGDSKSRVDDSRRSIRGRIVTNSTAFQWLIHRVHRESGLTVSEANKMHAIATQIRQNLYSQPQNCFISSRRGPSTCSMVFKSDWDPLAFVVQQEYAEEPERALQEAVVLVQDANEDTEVMTCVEYLSRTWSLLGEELLGVVRHVVRSRPGLRCGTMLFDNTTIEAWIEPSGCLALKAAGVVETIVEVGEVYGWMTAALRSSPTEKITAITPILEISAESNGKSFEAYFGQKQSDVSLRSVGQRWQELFQNPVVVTGFPVRRRQPGQEPGLEYSLGMLTALLGPEDMVFFRKRVYIRGFCTMLVPTKYSDGTVYWHVLFNEDGSRIAFTDPRVRKVAGHFNLMKHLNPSQIL